VSTPSGRGDTIVSERAFIKITEQAAAEDDRVAERPHASGSVSGSVAAVHLDLAVRYPAPVLELASELREHVRSRVRDLTGITIENVDIEVVRLVPAQRRAEERP